MKISRLLYPILCCACVPRAQGADSRTLTLTEALSWAREHAPVVLAMRAASEEARARVDGARLPIRDNPALELGAGPRTSPVSRTTDLDVGWTQGFEPAGRRRARVLGAQAALASVDAAADESARSLLREVALAFHAAVHARERDRLAGGAEQVASDLHETAQRLADAGEVPALDVQIAGIALARARANRQSARADGETALGRLRVLLGMGPLDPLDVRGDLLERPDRSLIELLAASEQRPDLRALEAAVREADADDQVGASLARPQLGAALTFEREVEDKIWMGGVRITLPLFEQGRAARAEAQARSRRRSFEREAAGRAAAVEVESAWTVWRLRVDAVEELERGALPLLDETESLLVRSYEAGQIGLFELLLGRRQSFETRAEHLDLLLAAAQAGVEVDAAAGVLR